MIRSVPWSFFLLLALSPALRAAPLDAQEKVPYSYHLVVRFGDHPHFTPQFRDEFKRQLLGTFRASLEALATVEVYEPAALPREQWSKLWKSAFDLGLKGIEPGIVPYDPNEFTGKTHFLFVDQESGQYRLESRQFDGALRFASPVVRRQLATDRNYLVRVASLLVGRDFGATGTFEVPPNERDKILVRLKGGGLQVPMERWVKKGDVFRVFRVERAPRRSIRPFRSRNDKSPAPAAVPDVPQPEIQSREMEGVLLQATDDPKNGVVIVRLFSRYAESFPVNTRVLGYRAVKIGTVDMPLKLQLVDDAGQVHRAGLFQVKADQDHFPSGQKDGVDAAYQNQGRYFTTQKVFSNMACVRVSVGERVVARVPVEFVTDAPVRVVVKLDANAELRARLEQVRRDQLARVNDTLTILFRCFQDMIALGKQEGKNAEALGRAERVSALVGGEIGELKNELGRLTKRLEDEKFPNPEGFTRTIADRLAILEGDLGKLKEHMAKLADVVEQENDPATKAERDKIQALIREGELHLQNHDYDKAIEALDRAVAMMEEGEPKTKLQARVARLKELWAVKDAAHAAARKFFLEKWFDLDSIDAAGAQIPEARRAFETCKAAGDRLTIRRALAGLIQLETKLDAQVQGLDGSTDEGRAQLEALRKLVAELETLANEMKDFVATGKKE